MKQLEIFCYACCSVSVRQSLFLHAWMCCCLPLLFTFVHICIWIYLIYFVSKISITWLIWLAHACMDLVDTPSDESIFFFFYKKRTTLLFAICYHKPQFHVNTLHRPVYNVYFFAVQRNQYTAAENTQLYTLNVFWGNTIALLYFDTSFA